MHTHTYIFVCVCVLCFFNTLINNLITVYIPFIALTVYTIGIVMTNVTSCVHNLYQESHLISINQLWIAFF